LSERSLIDAKARVAQPNRVRDVECLGTNLDRLTLANTKIARNGFIPFPESRAANGIESQVAIRASHGSSKCRVIDPVYTRSRRAGLALFRRFPVRQHLIGTLSGGAVVCETIERNICSGNDVQGLSGAALEDCRKGPAGSDHARRA